MSERERESERQPNMQTFDRYQSHIHCKQMWHMRDTRRRMLHFINRTISFTALLSQAYMIRMFALCPLHLFPDLPLSLSLYVCLFHSSIHNWMYALALNSVHSTITNLMKFYARHSICLSASDVYICVFILFFILFCFLCFAFVCGAVNMSRRHFSMQFNWMFWITSKVNIEIIKLFFFPKHFTCKLTIPTCRNYNNMNRWDR